MKISVATMGVICLLAIGLYVTAGDLEPSGPPTAGTMKTLDEIYTAASSAGNVYELQCDYFLSGTEFAAEDRGIIAMRIGEYPGSGIPSMEGLEDVSLILDLEHTVNQPYDQSTGSVSGVRQHGALSIVKHIDKATPGLHKALCTGQHLQEAAFDFYRIDPATREQEVYYTITLGQAVVVEIGPTTDFVTPDGKKHMEKVSFIYEEIEWNWLPDSIIEMDRWAAPGS